MAPLLVTLCTRVGMWGLGRMSQRVVCTYQALLMGEYLLLMTVLETQLQMEQFLLPKMMENSISLTEKILILKFQLMQQRG